MKTYKTFYGDATFNLYNFITRTACIKSQQCHLLPPAVNFFSLTRYGSKPPTNDQRKIIFNLNMLSLY